MLERVKGLKAVYPEIFRVEASLSLYGTFYIGVFFERVL